MKPTRQLLLLLLIAFFPVRSLWAQSFPDSIRRKVDSLFTPWASTLAPGCVAGIVMGDSLVYSQGFGLAKLEDRQPATPESIYYMCSVSKQFAGYAIAHLVKEGKIRLDDDIHRYLPAMKDFGAKITVAHLLHHTSGLRDDIRLMDLFGLNGDGLLTQAHGVRMLEQQHSLNFAPGEKYAYSNSNYVLLAAIVEKVSGTSFRNFTDSIIFQPLGMHASIFADDPSALMPGLAPSYFYTNGRWHQSRQNVYTLGDGGLFTSLSDMAKWVKYLIASDTQTQSVVALMTQTSPLNDGRRNSYAMGISVDTVNGYRRLLHNGGLNGYRTEVVVFPALRIGCMVFGNGSDNAVYGKVSTMAGMLMPPAPAAVAPAANLDTTTFPQPDAAVLQKLVGQYIAADGFRVDVTVENGVLRVGPNVLVAASAIEYFIRNRPAVRYRFAGEEVQLISPAVARPIQLRRAGPAPAGVALKHYTGQYYSDELDCRFTITLQAGKLSITHTRLGQADLTLLGPDHGISKADFVRHILFRRNSAGRIIGFDYNDGNIMHLHFKKERPVL